MSLNDRWLQSQIAPAIADLSRRLGVAESSIAVVRAERVTWRDGGLGCPQPGMRYTQALVPGSFIQLAAGQTTYNYHGGRNGPPRLCQSPNEVFPESLPTNPYV